MELGNHLLYLLSKKVSLDWSQFREYTEDIFYRQDNISSDNLDNYEIYSFARNLSSLGYLDIGENKNKTVVQIAPTMFIKLPLIQSTFLLTGSRSCELLNAIKEYQETQKIPNKQRQKLLPDTIIMKIQDQDLESLIGQCSFQGNQLSDYCKIHNHPIAWNILEFAGDISQYEQSLSSEWHSGNVSEIKKIFDIKSLKFQDFYSNKQLNNLSLIKISYYEKFYTYYLFRSSNGDKVRVDLDWGRFIIAKQLDQHVLKYDQRKFELHSKIRLPAIFERGLTLLSGFPPNESNVNEKGRNKKFTFKSVPYQIAKLAAEKLGQKLRFQKEKK